jgi:hypothetical protein
VIDPMIHPPLHPEGRVVLLALLAPVMIGVFLLAMERLERKLLDTVPAAGYDHALLARSAGGQRTRRRRAAGAGAQSPLSGSTGRAPA